MQKQIRGHKAQITLLIPMDVMEQIEEAAWRYRLSRNAFIIQMINSGMQDIQKQELRKRGDNAIPETK